MATTQDTFQFPNSGLPSINAASPPRRNPSRNRGGNSPLKRLQIAYDTASTVQNPRKPKTGPILKDMPSQGLYLPNNFLVDQVEVNADEAPRNINPSRKLSTTVNAKGSLGQQRDLSQRLPLGNSSAANITLPQSQSTPIHNVGSATLRQQNPNPWNYGEGRTQAGRGPPQPVPLPQQPASKQLSAVDKLVAQQKEELRILEDEQRQQMEERRRILQDKQRQQLDAQRQQLEDEQRRQLDAQRRQLEDEQRRHLETLNRRELQEEQRQRQLLEHQLRRGGFPLMSDLQANATINTTLGNWVAPIVNSQRDLTMSQTAPKLVKNAERAKQKGRRGREASAKTKARTAVQKNVRPIKDARKKQVSKQSRSKHQERDADDEDEEVEMREEDEDEDEDAASSDGEHFAFNEQNKDDPADPRNYGRNASTDRRTLAYYRGFVQQCLKDTNQQVIQYIAETHAFPCEHDIDPLIRKYLREAQASRLAAGREILEGQAFTSTEDLVKAGAHYFATFRSDVVKYCRSKVTVWYPIHAGVSTRNMDLWDANIVAKNVEKLIGKDRDSYSGFFLQGPREQDHKTRFEHIAVEDVILNKFYHCKWVLKDPEATFWSFIPLPTFALVGTALYHSIDEYRTGRWKRADFSAADNTRVYGSLLDSLFWTTVDPASRVAQRFMQYNKQVVGNARATTMRLPPTKDPRAAAVNLAFYGSDSDSDGGGMEEEM